MHGNNIYENFEKAINQIESLSSDHDKISAVLTHLRETNNLIKEHYDVLKALTDNNSQSAVLIMTIQKNQEMVGEKLIQIFEELSAYSESLNGINLKIISLVKRVELLERNES